MLLQHKKTPYIGILKLATGEEIITTVSEDTLTSMIVKNPLCMVATDRGFQFAPFMMMADASKDITINRSSVVATTVPTPELEGQYESVVTGIALPKKSSIIT